MVAYNFDCKGMWEDEIVMHKTLSLMTEFLTVGFDVLEHYQSLCHYAFNHQLVLILSV